MAYASLIGYSTAASRILGVGSRIAGRETGETLALAIDRTYKEVDMIKNLFLLAAAANADTLDRCNQALPIKGERLGRVS
jgi:hypothetical protein